MNVEDLRKLKADLESKTMYVPISHLFAQNNVIGLPMSKKDVIKQDNTDEVVKQIEALIEKAVIMLAGKGIPFDHLEISSELGFFCTTSYLYEFKKLSYDENESDNMDYDNLMAFYRKLESNVVPNIVPVSFKFNYYNTGINDGCCVEQFAKDYGLNPEEEFNLGTVSGYVDWTKFVIKLNELGYNIKFVNYDDGVSFQDYIEAVISAGDDTEIDICADFGTTKKMEM